MNMIELLKTNNNYEPISGPGAGGTDKESGHNYVSSFYEDALKKYRNKKIDLLEVGLAYGASLRLWDEYFSDVTIYGVDIRNNINPNVDTSRFHLFFEDGYNQDFLNKIPDMDIIIDDGPHTFESQINFLIHYMNKVKPGGLLIIEDIAKIEYVETFKKFAGDKPYTVVDTREQYGIFDNILFAINY
jgi:SAM-dependent methyltransferase